MPRIKRTLESQSLYIKMLEKLAKDFEADLAKAKEIYKDLEQLENEKDKHSRVSSGPARSAKIGGETKKRGRPAKKEAATAKTAARRGRPPKSATEPKKRGRPPKTK
ncbi:MAG TPA: hypothetical protein VMC79_07745 [Rectinemataceae bacterium]|nr:hypothetical protein [Rectinemataceae bacterium]